MAAVEEEGRKPTLEFRGDSSSLRIKLQALAYYVLVTLPLTVNETLKWLSSLPILMQIILVVTV